MTNDSVRVLVEVDETKGAAVRSAPRAAVVKLVRLLVPRTLPFDARACSHFVIHTEA